MIIKKAPERITVEHDGGKFTFKYPNPIQQLAISDQKSSADMFQTVFNNLLERIEGVQFDDGKEMNKATFLVTVDVMDLTSILEKFFEEFKRIREAKEKKESFSQQS